MLFTHDIDIEYDDYLLLSEASWMDENLFVILAKVDIWLMIYMMDDSLQSSYWAGLWPI